MKFPTGHSASPGQPDATLPKGDALLVRGLCVLGALAVLGLLIVPRFFLPSEDAVILMQFSHNLAHHGAITYIPFGPHAEGATDFAWMVLVASMMKVGVDPFWGMALVNMICLPLLAVLLLRLAGVRVGAVPLLFVCCCFALMPEILAAVAGFSTLPFACLLVLFTMFVVQGDEFLTPLVALLLCLFRPDGVVFAVPLLIAALILHPGRIRRFSLQGGLFVVPGLLYFLWRWHYFGELLPLPFLVKSDTRRYLHLFSMGSVADGISLNFFVLVMLWFLFGGASQGGLRRNVTVVAAGFPILLLLLQSAGLLPGNVARGHLPILEIFAVTILTISILWLPGAMQEARNRAVFLCLVVIPNAFYFAMRLDQDQGRRFFIYLPVALAVLIAMNWRSVRGRRTELFRLGVGAYLLLAAPVLLGEAKGFGLSQFPTRKAVGEGLATLPHGTMIVSEAGIVPYYSGWSAYDPWGLNTATFAKRLFQPSDVAALNPDLIMLHTDSGECPRSEYSPIDHTKRNWDAMTENIFAGAPPADYELWTMPYAAEWGRKLLHIPPSALMECWLVKRGSPLRDGVVSVLQRHGAVLREATDGRAPR